MASSSNQPGDPMNLWWDDYLHPASTARTSMRWSSSAPSPASAARPRCRRAGGQGPGISAADALTLQRIASQELAIAAVPEPEARVLLAGGLLFGGRLASRRVALTLAAPRCDAEKGVAAFVIAGAWASAALGADIYRWADENGNVHLADIVPQRYKASAQRIDSRQFELTPAQQREAEARLARERQALTARPVPASPPAANGLAPAPRRQRAPRRPIARPCSASTARASSASRRSSTPTAR